jgi:hypothetical protein
LRCTALHSKFSTRLSQPPSTSALTHTHQTLHQCIINLRDRLIRITVPISTRRRHSTHTRQGTTTLKQREEGVDTQTSKSEVEGRMEVGRGTVCEFKSLGPPPSRIRCDPSTPVPLNLTSEATAVCDDSASFSSLLCFPRTPLMCVSRRWQTNHTIPTSQAAQKLTPDKEQVTPKPLPFKPKSMILYLPHPPTFYKRDGD